MKMAKKLLLVCCLLNSEALLAQPLTAEKLMVSGRALANYQTCSQLAQELGDSAMYGYYSDMFHDSAAIINRYPESQSKIVYGEFTRSMIKFKRLNKMRLGAFCSSRFSLLSRKMQERKLAGK